MLKNVNKRLRISLRGIKRPKKRFLNRFPKNRLFSDFIQQARTGKSGEKRTISEEIIRQKLRKKYRLRRKKRSLKAGKTSWAKQKRKGKRFLKKILRKSSDQHVEYILSRLERRNFSKVVHGILTIKETRRNCFMNISKKVLKIKKQRFQKKRSKKPHFRVLLHKSIGQASIFRGRAKSSAVAKKALAKSFLPFVHKKQLRMMDAFFISAMKRVSGLLLAPFAEKNIVFRSISRKLLRPHGYVKRKKARRI